MKVAIFQFAMFGIITYVVYDPKTLDCVVIDPGMSSKEEEDAIASFIDDNNLKLNGIINTHLHLDHAVGVNFIKDKYGVPAMANQKDEYLGERLEQQARMFGLIKHYKDVGITRYLKDGDEIKIGDGCFHVLEVPGHSPGSIALYDKEDNFVIVGDALFKGSIGRTDLTGGDYPTLINSIKTKLLTLPDETVIFPGHGPSSTIGEEKSSNPYIR